MVDVLFHDVIAGEPDPVHPVANHILHVGPAGLPLPEPERPLIAESAHRQNLADGSVENALARLDASLVMPHLCPSHHRESLRLGLPGSLHYRARPDRIDCDGLFQKAMFLRGDGSCKVLGAEVRRGRIQHDVHAGIEEFLVSIETDKAIRRGNLLFVFPV